MINYRKEYREMRLLVIECRKLLFELKPDNDPCRTKVTDLIKRIREETGYDPNNT